MKLVDDRPVIVDDRPYREEVRRLTREYREKMPGPTVIDYLFRVAGLIGLAWLIARILGG